MLKNAIKVAIVNYEMGNIFSVQHACEHVGLSSFVTSNKADISTADALILPGVGAFGEAMRNLKRLDLISVIKDFVASGRPFMGICLGLQLLFTESEEFGSTRGLDIVNGTVVRFPNIQSEKGKIKVPQIGWNQVYPPIGRGGTFWNETPFQETRNGAYMYFVHSYYAVPASDAGVLSITHYGDIGYCSSLLVGNVFATQFHPEKSAREGIDIYKKWAEISHTGKEK